MASDTTSAIRSAASFATAGTPCVYRSAVTPSGINSALAGASANQASTRDQPSRTRPQRDSALTDSVLRVIWSRDFVFRGALVDLRGSEQADALLAELQLEVAPGHPLHGRSWRVIARAVPNDDVVVEYDDKVAVVHLTWSGKQERPPWPTTIFITTAEELSTYVESRYGWEPD